MDIPAGASVSLVFTAEVVAPDNNQDYVNVAEITAADQWDVDSTPGNGADSSPGNGIGPLDDDASQDPDDEDDGDDGKVDVQVIDLELIKSVLIDNVEEDCPEVNVGQTVTFRINVTNQGPDDATNVEVTDLVPNGYTNIDAPTGNVAGSTIT